MAVGGGQGELMCFDVGLAPLGLRLVAEELADAPATLRLSEQLRCTGGLEGLHWGKGPDGQAEGCDLLMLALHGGPLAALRFRLGKKHFLRNICFVRSSTYLFLSCCTELWSF